MSRGSSTPGASEATVPFHRHGLSPRGERILDIVGSLVILFFAGSWIWVGANARHLLAAESEAAGTVAAPTSGVRGALRGPKTAFLTEATLNAITDHILDKQRGVSGKLKAVIQSEPGAVTPESLPPGASIQYRQGEQVSSAPTGSGIWNVLLNVGNAIRPISNFNVITMLPFTAKKNGRVGLYYVGNWPGESGKAGPSKAPSGAYGNPKGFIEVTPENADTPVSEHFKLRDFLTHDQPNVWPKYLVLQPKLIDKLELVMSDLQAHGIDTKGVKVMSGFRTPQYNVGGGNTGGRASLSRHMYGDASDIYIDNNGDGQMDDLNHDGKITIDDSRVIAAAVDRVEAAHPELVGGAGVYTAAPGHGPFIHIDTRGYRARWMGTSGG